MSGEIPFDVSRHDQACSEVAVKMMERLRKDVSLFADMQNGGLHARLPAMLQEQIDTIVSSPAAGCSVVTQLYSLIRSLEDLRNHDYRHLNSSLPLVTSMANHVEIPDKARLARNDPQAVAAYSFCLRRYSGGELKLWNEHLIGSILSDRHAEDLGKLNPYLTEETLNVVGDLLHAILLHANRIGQANR